MSEPTEGKEPNLKPYMLKLKGKDYLTVQGRIIAFRAQCPIGDGWGVRTERVAGGYAEGWATYHAEVTDPAGRVVAAGTKSEDKAGFPDYEEKAESGSIGRALGLAGFGTAYALEFFEGTERIVDTPVGTTYTITATSPPSAVVSDLCTICGKPGVLKSRVTFCQSRSLPVTHPTCGN